MFRQALIKIFAVTALLAAPVFGAQAASLNYLDTLAVSAIGDYSASTHLTPAANTEYFYRLDIGAAVPSEIAVATSSDLGLLLEVFEAPGGTFSGTPNGTLTYGSLNLLDQTTAGSVLQLALAAGEYLIKVTTDVGAIYQVSVTATPIPGALLLFLSGVVGLLGFSRIRKQTA